MPGAHTDPRHERSIMPRRAKTPSREIIPRAETVGQVLAKEKAKLIRIAKNRFLINLASCIPEEDWLPNRNLINAVVDAYRRGYSDAINLWYQCVKD